MTKHRLLAGTAIVAATAMAGSQAHAFDEVNWTWTLDANTVIDQTITTNTELTPTGLAAVEDIQVFIGDLSSSSSVSGVTNSQPSNGSTPDSVSADFVLDLEGDASVTDNGALTLDGGATATVTPDGGGDALASVDGQIGASGNTPLGDSFDGQAGFTVTIDVPIGDNTVFDAIDELPEVVSAAVSVANNANIDSHVKTDVHDTQILFDSDPEEVLGSYSITETTATEAGEQSQSFDETYAEAAQGSISGSYSKSYSDSYSLSATETVSDSFESTSTFDATETIGSTSASSFDRTVNTTTVASLTEDLSATGAASGSADWSAGTSFTGNFTVDGTGDYDGSASLDQTIESEVVDVALNVAGSESVDVNSLTEGEFDGEGTIEGTRSGSIDGTLDVAKTVNIDGTVNETESATTSDAFDSTETLSEMAMLVETFDGTQTQTVDYTETANLDIEGSASAEYAAGWDFSESASSSFSTETFSKDVETEGDLYALDTAFALWGDLLDQGVNTGMATTLSLMVAGAYGGLEKSQVSADSMVDDITNASVDSSATAIGNNKGIDLQAATANDAMLVADVNQFAYADMTAMSNVSDVLVENYTNLGLIDRPLVNSVATSIGNNLSVTVESPLSPTPSE